MQTQHNPINQLDQIDQMQTQHNQLNQIHTHTIPLENVNIIGYMIDNLGKINYELIFLNQTDKPINPIHYFSLDPKATICKFTMMVGSRVFIGTVQEKTQAHQTYSSAQSEGKKTALIEKISDTDYKVSVGNVEPYERVIIGFNYLIVLDLEDDNKYKFNIPTNIGIKYFSSNQTQTDWEYQQSISKLKWCDNPTYTFDFELKWISSNNFISFETNQELIEIELDECLIFKGSSIPLQGEINMFVQTDSEPSGYIYEDELTQKAYILSNIKIPNETVSDETKSKKNFMFILDRSGSMGGERIVKAKEALKTFIENIPNESYFNVISFGSDYSAIWSNSVPAHDFFKNTCLTDVESFDANMGGTEIYNCLKDSFCSSDIMNMNMNTNTNTDIDDNFKQFKNYKLEAKKTCPKTHENIIIILTDGEVGSIYEIFNLVKKMNSNDTTNLNTRIFTFGLGTHASKHFIKGISDLTFGDYAMIMDSDDLILPIKKIINTVNKQYYTNIELSLNIDFSSNTNIPINKINSVYPEKIYSIVYEIELEQFKNLKSNGLKIKGINPLTKKVVEWNIDIDNMVNEHFDYSIIKKIYFNECINKIEKSIQFDNLNFSRKNLLEKEIIQMSVQNNIMNIYTSFVLVDNTSQYNINQIGHDVVVPHSSNISNSNLKCIYVNPNKSSLKNTTLDLNSITLSRSVSQSVSVSSFTSPFTSMNFSNLNWTSQSGQSAQSAQSTQSAQSAQSAQSTQSEEFEELECLSGGMDMFGGGGGRKKNGGFGDFGGKYVEKYNVSINWVGLKKLLNKTNGSYRFEQDSWKLLCYIEDTDFNSHCTQVNLSDVLFFNFIILIELYKNGLIQESMELKNYLEEKHSGLFDLKKKEVEQIYHDYIEHLKTFVLYESDSDY